MTLPKAPKRNKQNQHKSDQQSDSPVQTSVAHLHGSVPGRMVVLGPERTFKLRDPLDPAGLLQGSDSSSGEHPRSPEHNDRSVKSITRSLTLIDTHDELLKDSRSRTKLWPKNYCFCLLGAFFCIGIGAAFGIYFGFQNAKPDKIMDYVYRGSLRVSQGDRFDPLLEDSKSLVFAEKARQYEQRLDKLFKSSSLKDVFLYTEVLAFERRETENLAVFFNIYCWAKKTSTDTQDMESVLRESNSFFDGLVVDPNSIEIKARSSESSSSLGDSRSVLKAKLPEDTERRLDKDNESLEYVPGSGSRDGRRPSNSVDAGRNRNSVLRPTSKIPSPNLESPDAPTCVPLTLQFCSHLEYNITSYPNLLAHRGLRDNDRLAEAARMLAESDCSPYIQHVLCHILQPPCKRETTDSEHLPPCRSVCTAVLTSCKAKLASSSNEGKDDYAKEVVLGLRDLLRCDLFPIDDGLNSCTPKPAPNKILDFEPSSCVKEMHDKQLENRICDGLMDCHDFSDEMACDYCPYGMVHCGVGAACIEGVKRCDGTPDCPNGSDERGCLTVAPDMEAANFVHQYFQDGFVIFTEGNKTGKICADVLTSANFTSAKRNSFLEAFGESACRSMSYRTMDLIEVRTDNERSSEYAHIKDSSQLKASFSKDPCSRRQVLYLSCSELECGVRPVHMHPDRPSRGLNVLPASHGDWPWMAALFRDGVHVCDATLVAEKWLITSASCFEGQGRAHWVARFAAVRLSSDAPWEQERRIVGMVKSPVDSSNLVLVKLSSPVIYSDFVRPVCLARDKHTWMTPTSRCVSLGWGKDGDNLHEATTRIIVNENCNNTVQVCAELASVKDACRNVEVTGGPLLCQEVEDGAWSLVGVAKENYHCDALTFEVNRLYDGIIPLSTWIVQTVRQT